MSRAVLALGEPPESLKGFPFGFARMERYRAHDKDYGPWWFATAPADPALGGRFDLPAPHGTCYVALGIEVAVRERLGSLAAGHRWIPDSPVLARTTVSILHPDDWPGQGKVASAIHKRATGWVTREIGTCVNYALTQRWAAAFAIAGFSGVRYEPRFSVGAVYAEGWFGDAGAHEFPSEEVTDWRDSIPLAVSAIRVARAHVID